MKKWEKRLGRTSIIIAIISYCVFFSHTVLAQDKPAWEKWDSPGKPVRGGDYRIAATVDVGLLNPHHWPVMDWNVIDMLFEQYVVSADDAIFRPWIAE